METGMSGVSGASGVSGVGGAGNGPFQPGDKNKSVATVGHPAGPSFLKAREKDGATAMVRKGSSDRNR
jgi:hypothetical protein